VRVFDTFWYGRECFKDVVDSTQLKLIQGDIRDVDAVKNAMKGATDVIHLACISNDPSFDLNPELGKSINLDSFKPLVAAAKRQGIKRFIYASSSSVYGVKEEPRVSEELSLKPLTDYSKFKANCEEIILESATSDFVCTVLRPATVCGVSSRQRFDLSVNILTNHAVNLGKITVFGGSQFRPNLHINDMSDAYLHVLLQESPKIAGKIYNVGGENLSLNEISSKVSAITNVSTILHEPTNDLRSYRVDSSKIKTELGFVPKRTIDNAITDLYAAFKNNFYTNALEYSQYFNIKKMKELSVS